MMCVCTNTAVQRYELMNHRHKCFFKENNSKILFSACDTFRAAAIDQLEQWANIIEVEVIKSSN